MILRTSLFFLILVMSSSTVAAEKINVFVSIPPQKWLIDRIGGELLSTNVLVGKGQDPHTFEPSPKQIAALSAAKIWFISDMEFEHQLMNKIKQNNPKLHIVEMNHDVKKLEIKEDHHHDDHGHDDQHKHAEDNHADHHDENHSEHEEYDPHVWLSPTNLKKMADTVTLELTEQDNPHATVYRQNNIAFQQELTELHREITAKLAPFAGSSFYVYHPSFGHFAHTYKLEQHAVEIEGKSPTPKQIKALISQAKSENIKVIFVQPQFDPKSAQAVASAIGGNVVALDALEEDVMTNLKTMADKISSALAQ